MSYQEILDNVVWNIARPDLATTRVPYAILQALRQAHNLGFFQKDIQKITFEDLVTASCLSWADPDSQVVADIVLQSPTFNLPYTWRRVHDIEVFSDAAYLMQTTQIFKDRAVDPLYDDFKRVWQDYYMQVGSLLRINFSATPAYAKLCYFAYPTLESADNSFLVQDYPMYIANLATQKLANHVGLSDLASSLVREIAMQEDQILTTETTVR